MAVLKSNDNKNMIINCNCGCDSSMRFAIDVEENDMYCLMTYMSGNFYKEQDGVLRMLRAKLSKIIAVIRNKDFYYADVIMNKEEFGEFRDYINFIGEAHI